MMRLTRRKVIIASMLAIVWASGSLLLFNSGASVRDAERIKAGMTMEEVNAVLGRLSRQVNIKSCSLVRDAQIWACTDGTCSIAFGHDDKVLWCTPNPDAHWWDSFYRRVRWQFGYDP